jgi:tetratricopeptide (TPR) repeat protein
MVCSNRNDCGEIGENLLMMINPIRTLMLATALLIGIVLPLAAQEDARKLFEAGKYKEAVAKIPGDASPEGLYLKGLSYRKLDQNDEAKAAFRSMEQGGEDWKAVGESAVALVDGDVDRAVEMAKTAVERNGGLAQAQYQLGLAYEAKGEHGPAAEAFAKAAEAQPQMAYAHYNAGMNYYKAKRVDKMAVYFENFLKLAPNAPERKAVESILRTLRGK